MAYDNRFNAGCCRCNSYRDHGLVPCDIFRWLWRPSAGENADAPTHHGRFGGALLVVGFGRQGYASWLQIEP